jgi:N-acetylglucosaminyldiphosphoundecaprenol N-acetyl-beta-D-mannosaminyltransferase
MKEKILGYDVDVTSVMDFSDELYTAVLAKQADCVGGQWLACLNPHSYAVAKVDTHFSRALKHADWLIPDGVGVVQASRILGGRIRKRITGSDVFSALLKRMNHQGGHSVFFLGATEDTLAKIRTKMAHDYPKVRVAGTYSPPFKAAYSEEELDAMIYAINAAKPDVLWVGMTAPKQEKWIYDNLARLDVRFAGAIGAVFDFYTGKVKRSHPMFQSLGLEWLPRLIQQPRRLWRRIFISAPEFLIDVIRARLFGFRG